MTRKKVTFDSAEQREEQVADFVARVHGIARSRLFFTDEVSTDKRSRTRQFGRAVSGQRALGIRVFVRGQRYSSVGQSNNSHILNRKLQVVCV